MKDTKKRKGIESKREEIKPADDGNRINCRGKGEYVN